MGRSERQRTSAAMAPVVLRTDVHCFGCAKKIRRSVRDLLGVERVWASPDTGLVHVAGTADATVLRRRIQDKMRRPVSIVSDGTEDQLGHHYEMTHPTSLHYTPTPAGHQPLYYTWASTSSHPHHHYAPPQPAGHTYGGNHYWALQPRRYVSNGTPTRFDDEIPDHQYCCSIQ